MKPVAVILGSAYLKDTPESFTLDEISVSTPWGDQKLYEVKGIDRPAYLLFRHGVPHRLLPHQVNYRAQAWALKEVECGALMVTSSVGVMDADLPLFQPLLVSDLLMPENRLPDGSTCTIYEKPDENHGHLVLSEGLFSKALGNQLRELAGDSIADSREVVFAYSGGPRGKTAAENRMWRKLGAQVNSMTLAPEIILANELEISSTAVVAGHKYSVPDLDNPQNEEDVTESLNRCRIAMEDLIIIFLHKGKSVPFANHIYRFD